MKTDPTYDRTKDLLSVKQDRPVNLIFFRESVSRSMSTLSHEVSRALLPIRL